MSSTPLPRVKAVNAAAAVPGAMRSLGKAIEVLEAFSGKSRYMTLSELVARTGLDKSAVQRITRTLRDTGYIDQDPVTRRYCLGTRVLDLSYSFLRTNELVERATPLLVEFGQQIRERVDLAIYDGDSSVYVVRVPAKREIFRPALIGRRVPNFCSAAGRALLARSDDEGVLRQLQGMELKPFTPQTKTDPAEILAQVRLARERGCAIQQEEWQPNEMVAAAVVLGASGQPIGALNISVSMREWTFEKFERAFSQLLIRGAHEFSALT